MAYLIVIDGGDAVGKHSQAELIAAMAKGNGYDAEILAFPAYGQKSCAPVEMYLGGEFGKDPNAVNPYAASLLYCVDRFGTFKKVDGGWEKIYKKPNTILVADRYTTSNALFQAAKFDNDEEKAAFLDWLYDLEYNKVGLPRPDKVLYLNVSAETSEVLRSKREKETGTSPDIHETLEFQRKARASAEFVCKHGKWSVIQCENATKDGLLPREQITKLIWAEIAKIL